MFIFTFLFVIFNSIEKRASWWWIIAFIILDSFLWRFARHVQERRKQQAQQCQK